MRKDIPMMVRTSIHPTILNSTIRFVTWIPVKIFSFPQNIWSVKSNFLIILGEFMIVVITDVAKLKTRKTIRVYNFTAACGSVYVMTSSNGNIFRVNWPFVRGIHRSPVNSPHKGQWRGALMFSLICAGINGWVKQSWGWWFETPSCSLWRHRNESPSDVGQGYGVHMLDIQGKQAPPVCDRWRLFSLYVQHVNSISLTHIRGTSAVVPPSELYGMRLNEGSGQSRENGKMFKKISAHCAKERGPIAGWAWLTKFGYYSAAAGVHENIFHDLLRSWVGASPLTAHTHTHTFQDIMSMISNILEGIKWPSDKLQKA